MGKYVIKKTATGFNFQLKAGNGEPILASEVYTTLKAAQGGCESVKKAAPVANIEDQTVQAPVKQSCPKFEIYADKAGKIRFRLIARNGENIGASEPYNSKQSCKNGIDSVKRNADSPVFDPAE